MFKPYLAVLADVMLNMADRMPIVVHVVSLETSTVTDVRPHCDEPCRHILCQVADGKATTAKSDGILI